MNQKEKALLISDLCARLPYGVIMGNKTLKETSYRLSGQDIDDAEFDDKFDDVPYLRPMSSMTKKEYEELKEISPYYGFASFKYIYDWAPNYEMIDWLNVHHFDYRGLIEKGLAIEAPSDMYK